MWRERILSLQKSAASVPAGASVPAEGPSGTPLEHFFGTFNCSFLWMLPYKGTPKSTALVKEKESKQKCMDMYGSSFWKAHLSRLVAMSSSIKTQTRLHSKVIIMASLSGRLKKHLPPTPSPKFNTRSKDATRGSWPYY